MGEWIRVRDILRLTQYSESSSVARRARFYLPWPQTERRVAPLYWLCTASRIHDGRGLDEASSNLGDGVAVSWGSAHWFLSGLSSGGPYKEWAKLPSRSQNEVLHPKEDRPLLQDRPLHHTFLPFWADRTSSHVHIADAVSLSRKPRMGS